MCDLLNDCRSSTFEAQGDSVVADLAADAAANCDDTTRGHPCRPARVVVLHGPARQGFDADPLERLLQRREALGRHEAVIERGFNRARVKPISDLDEPALLDEIAQGTADLVLAAKIGKIGAQKHVAAFAVNRVNPLQ
jgi:hypothetical protein